MEPTLEQIMTWVLVEHQVHLVQEVQEVELSL